MHVAVGQAWALGVFDRQVIGVMVERAGGRERLKGAFDRAGSAVESSHGKDALKVCVSV